MDNGTIFFLSSSSLSGFAVTGKFSSLSTVNIYGGSRSLLSSIDVVFSGEFPGLFPGRFPVVFPGLFPGVFPGVFPGAISELILSIFSSQGIEEWQYQ